MNNPPFRRLLSFFSRQSGGDTISFLDSLRGDLRLGLDFPVAVVLALTRQLIFRTSGLSIHIPSVRSNRQLLGGPGAFKVDPSRRYSCGELVQLVGEGEKASWTTKADAFGLWMLAARRSDGKVSGEEVRLFQKGEVLESIAKRRSRREDVLPLWRGGPISVAGHSWFVKKLFDVDVYQR